MWRAARRGASHGATAAVEYPALAVLHRPGLLGRCVLLLVLFGRPRLRLHLHEFQHLRRMLRYPVTAALPLFGRVVVSSPSERDAVRAALPRWLRARTEVLAVPPTNATVPAPGGLEHPGDRRSPADALRVGVFGSLRPDKDPAWLAEVVAALGPRIGRLELIGRGWEHFDLQAGDGAPVTVVRRGPVATDELAAAFAAWDLAVAPFWEPPSDGRMSLRATLAHGVPTLTRGPLNDQLTLRPPHLAAVCDATALSQVELPVGLARASTAAEVAAFESAVTERLAAALFSPVGSAPL
jgi:glycosyltransferase involved in cell wall biosynthesis